MILSRLFRVAQVFILGAVFCGAMAPVHAAERNARASAEPRVANAKAFETTENAFDNKDLIDAGHRFFGSAAGGLSALIERSFATYGRPNGYILGQEGGGAFIAGVRYGEGRLRTRNRGAHSVFWQGPSLGFDFGADGARVMFLVYGLPAVEDLYRRFGGVDGSWYVVGGLGMAVLQWEKVRVVSIRAGLGWRGGVNVGYLKFTRSPTWNPF